MCHPRRLAVEPVATGPCCCFPGPLARNTCYHQISTYATLLTSYSLYMLPSTQTLLSQPLEWSKLREPEMFSKYGCCLNSKRTWSLRDKVREAPRVLFKHLYSNIHAQQPNDLSILPLSSIPREGGKCF